MRTRVIRTPLAMGTPFQGVISIGVFVFIVQASLRGANREAINIIPMRIAKVMPIRWKLLKPVTFSKLSPSLIAG